MGFCITKGRALYSHRSSLTALEWLLNSSRDEFVRTGKWPNIEGEGIGRVDFTEKISRVKGMRNTVEAFEIVKVDEDSYLYEIFTSVLLDALRGAEERHGDSGVDICSPLRVSVTKIIEWAEEVEDEKLHIVSSTLLSFLTKFSDHRLGGQDECRSGVRVSGTPRRVEEHEGEPI